MKKHSMFLTLAAMMLIMASCDGGASSIDSSSSSSISNSEPSSSSEVVKTVSITNVETTLFISKTLQMTYEASPVTNNVVWSVLPADKASISVSGLLTGLAAGEVVVKVALESLATVSDEYTLTIVDTLIDASVNTGAWDYEGLYSETPSFKSKDEHSNNFNSYAVFNDVEGKVYAASATAKVTNPKGDDTWSRFSIGHLDSSNKFHGMMVSPGANFGARKTVVMDITDGNVGWGLVTDRSQVWGFHSLSELNFDSVELLSVRKDNAYYYFVNGELFWMETLWADFNEIDSRPAIMAASLQIELSDLAVTTNAAEVDACIQNSAKLYPTIKNNVEISADGKSIQFKNATAAENAAPVNIKDNAAKSIGDAMILPAQKESTITFDLVIDAIGGRDAMPVVGITLNRHDNSPAEARSFLIGERRIGFSGWNTNGDLPNGIGSQGTDNLSEALLEGTTYKVTAIRLMSETSQDCRLKIAKLDGTVLGEVEWGWKSEGNSTGNVTLSFGTRDMNATLSNIEISVAA